MTAPLERVAEDQFLVVIAKADNRIGKLSAQTDIALTINGVKNKLTDPKWRYNNLNYNFTYVISSYEPIEELKLTFTKGYYRISELRAYSVDGSVLRDAMKNKDAFEIDRDASLGDSIKGSIDVSEDGWFTLSVPYDKGFRVTVDGEETEYYRTNAAFVGFPISAGSHDVEIVFEAPWKKQGLGISAAGAILIAGFSLAGFIADRKRGEKKKAEESSGGSDD